MRSCNGTPQGARARVMTTGSMMLPVGRRTYVPVGHADSFRNLYGNSGFTIIELMIVMSLIVVLAGIGLATHTNSQTRAREAVLKENLFRMRDAIDQYFADNNEYPPSLDAFVTGAYLRAVPVDPFTNSADTWQTTMSETDQANPSAQPGIFDVTSGSDRIAIEGVPYSDW